MLHCETTLVKMESFQRLRLSSDQVHFSHHRLGSTISQNSFLKYGNGEVAKREEGFTSSTCNYRNVCLGHKGTLPGNVIEMNNIDNQSHSNSFYN